MQRVQDVRPDTSPQTGDTPACELVLSDRKRRDLVEQIAAREKERRELIRKIDEARNQSYRARDHAWTLEWSGPSNLAPFVDARDEGEAYAKIQQIERIAAAAEQRRLDRDPIYRARKKLERLAARAKYDNEHRMQLR
jgi:hypothetical protein